MSRTRLFPNGNTAAHWHQRLLPSVMAMAILTLAIGLVWSLLLVPVHPRQGESFRIIFVHLPTARLSLWLYLPLFLTALWVLVRPNARLPGSLLASLAPTASAITLIAIVTGAAWARPTWGAWWVWDARLTAMLLLLFVYLAIHTLQDAFERRSTGARAAAILTLAGSVLVPIIHYSVYWWNTMHQAGGAPPGIAEQADTTRTALFLMHLATLLLALWLILERLRNQLLPGHSSRPQTF